LTTVLAFKQFGKVIDTVVLFVKSFGNIQMYLCST